ncbi:unnamed protein product, partial [Amoebophrya sp. A25]
FTHALHHGGAAPSSCISFSAPGDHQHGHQQPHDSHQEHEDPSIFQQLYDAPQLIRRWKHRYRSASLMSTDRGSERNHMDRDAEGSCSSSACGRSSRAISPSPSPPRGSQQLDAIEEKS